MTITLENIQFLAAAEGERLLQRLAAEDLSDKNTLKLLTTLRRDYTPDSAGAAVEMARLRLKAVEKFGTDAGRMFFTREALEQASDPLVRQYRAVHILQPSPLPPLPQDEGNKSAKLRIVDACCGIGADSLALAQTGADVLGLDIDPVRVEIARYNAAALGSTARFTPANVMDGLPEADVVFFDPARRDEQGKRIYDVERYQPPLSISRKWKAPLIAAKLSPGVELAQLAGYGGGVEFISVNGDLKEAVLWLGAGWNGCRATLLTEDGEYHWETIYPTPNPSPQAGRGLDNIELAEPRRWLVEPDAALLRAGLVQDAAAVFEGKLLDETIAYFTSDVRPDSPWVRAWEIRDWMPFNVKKLRAYLRERQVGNVTVKKRGSAVTPEVLIPQLKLKGSEARTLVLTRYRGQPIVIVCSEF